jgi:hypothetical protein
MALNRRIVLEDDEICIPTPPVVIDQTSETHKFGILDPGPGAWLERGGAMASNIGPAGSYGAMAHNVARMPNVAVTVSSPNHGMMTFEDITALGRIARQTMHCSDCNSATGFDTDIATSRITCNYCGRVVSVQKFIQEHS